MNRKLRWGIFLLVLFCGCWWADQEWNLRSNFLLYHLQGSDKDLLVENQNGEWESIFSLNAEDLQNQLRVKAKADGFQWAYLPIHRTAEDNWQGFANLLLSSRLQVLSFSPEHFTFESAFQSEFALSSASEILQQGQFQFAINANYFDENQRPLGQVIHEGEEYNRHFPNWSGYFFVKEGKPYFGPRSLLDETAGSPTELLQGYPSLIKDHQVFDYVHLKANPYFDGNTKTYRSLAGMRQDGTIVWIISGKGGIIDIRELAIIAQKLGLMHATIFDGGSSLQYRLDYAGETLSFHATSSRFDLSALVPRMEQIRPPVFIGVKAK